jgi:SAM-dependent methyltransferase/uncharacterized protein YbaR (Trm112 family)
MNDWLLPLLRCPICAGSLTHRPIGGSGANGILEHDTGECREQYPIIDGIPRLLIGASRAQVVRAHREWFARNPEVSSLARVWEGAASNDPVIAGFDDEWRRYPIVGTSDHFDLFRMYFDVVSATDFERGKTVLDAGCGAGRWAYEVARRGPRVIAVDLGMSIELARANTPRDLVACVQADIGALPLASASVDWAYSLGVLHHTDAPAVVLARVVDAVRPAGSVLVYFYYALDARGPAFRSLFRAVDLIRRMLSRQPRLITRTAALVIATFVYWPFARASALLERAGARGLAGRLPLSFYRNLSFATMRNDSLDRFGTRLERRYTQGELKDLMRGAGLGELQISESPPFWHAVGSKEMGKNPSAR